MSKDEKTLDIKQKIDQNYDIDNYLAILLTDTKDIIKGYPTEHGLRKLVTMFMGEIVGRSTNIVFGPNESIIATVNIYVKNEEGLSYTYSGTGETNLENSKAPYNKFPAALAETRATSRALRSILNIKTCSFDELNPDEIKNVEDVTETQALPETPSYIFSLIETAAAKKKIDLREYMQNNFGGKELKQLDYQSVQKVLNYLQGN